MRDLIDRVFRPVFGNDASVDAAEVSATGRMAFTTDTFVVQPLEFPGGDIGSLAVYGTVNDLAMAGARPVCLSAGFVLEEGLPLDRLQRIVTSMGAAAKRAGIRIVTGDTKVIERRNGDGLLINTAGIGLIHSSASVGPSRVVPGDAIVLSGDLARHGMAIVSVREGLSFESTIESDAAPLVEPVMALLDQGVEVHCLRDLTRGGLASAANEIASACGHELHLIESAMPVREDVRGACELLGFDPLHVANEGRFIAIVSPTDAQRARDILNACAEDTRASIVGEVRSSPQVRVTLKSTIGVTRFLDMLSGEQLPRIC